MADKELDRFLFLAGVRQEPDEIIVLLPKDPALTMRELLDKLKEITSDESRWNEIVIDGDTYLATGVTRG